MAVGPCDKNMHGLQVKAFMGFSNRYLQANDFAKEELEKLDTAAQDKALEK